MRLLHTLLFAFVFVFGQEVSAQEGRIEGIVTVGETPVGSAEVSIVNLGRTVLTDGDGKFAFDQIGEGDYQLVVDSPEWGRAIQTVTVTANLTSTTTIAIEAYFRLDELIVSAGPQAGRSSEAYLASSVLTSRDLVSLGSATLGETLSNLPGVSSTYFGPGSSRPVIRGLSGDRIRILDSGIDVGDASNTSPDHAVTVEPRSAERIEVIRGPATLLYGSSAIGGVVNVIDSKIAREFPAEKVSGFVEGLGGTVSDERTGSADLKISTGSVVLTGFFLRRDAGDYAIPGYAAEEHEEHEDEEQLEGVLENTAADNQRASVGLTLLGDKSYLGVAFTRQMSDYGIPGGAHGHGGGEEHEEHEDEEEEHEEGEHEEDITVDLDQNRFDLEGMVRFEGPVKNIKTRWGMTDYTHVEMEGDEVGTTFSNSYLEGRIESGHDLGSRGTGMVGFQYSNRDFEAIGEEAFVPPTQTKLLSMFLFEEMEASEGLSFQAGLRAERQTASARSKGISRSNSGFSGSLGINWSPSEVVSINSSVSRSTKLPTPEELFSNGPHLATQAYEIGDPNLKAEIASGLDLGFHVHADRFRGNLTFFRNAFSDFIYQEAEHHEEHEDEEGHEEHELTEYNWVQGDARFRGWELATELDLLQGRIDLGQPYVSIEFMMDAVNGKLIEDDGHQSYVPRTPPLRFGGGLNYRQGRFTIRTSLMKTTEQDKVAEGEHATEGFTMLDSSVSYRIISGRVFHDLTLTGTNLMNSEARLHTSFLKEFAPLPGRGIRLVYRLNF